MANMIELKVKEKTVSGVVQAQHGHMVEVLSTWRFQPGQNPRPKVSKASFSSRPLSLKRALHPTQLCTAWQVTSI